MGFFTPWFLAGVAAVGLPIWLHLLKRHQHDPKPFPSLMLFEPHEQTAVKYRRLDYILLFILRTAMLVLLALLFANPFINRATPKGAGEKIRVIAVDRSFSMRAADGTSTRLDKAKADALQLVGSLPPGTKAQVLALGGNIQAMTQQTVDPGELRAAVAAIQPSDSRASYGELSRYLRTLYENTKTPIEAHFFSDLQKSGLPPGFADLRLDPDTTLALHQVGGEVQNWAVENVTAPQRVYDPKKVRIQATIVSHAQNSAMRNVTLLLNGKTVQSKAVEVPAAGRATAEFLGLDASYGFNKCEVRIDTSDALPGDNSFLFAVERTDPKKVLFVDDGRQTRALKYFRDALDSAADNAFQLDVQRPEGAAAANLPSYALVVLSNPGQLPSSLEEALKRYVSAGGAVFEALGSSTAILPRVPVLDEAIESSRYAGREGERFLTVADADTGHSALKSAQRFEGVKFYQAIHVRPEKSKVLARLNDETPLLLERQMGEGKVMAFTSTLENVANDLPIHAAWVPFVQQTAAYLGGGGAEQPSSLAVDSYVELRTGDQSKGGSASAEVLDPQGKRVLSLEEAATARNFALNREGFFEVRTASGRRSLVAAHADRRESDLAVVPKETQDLWRATGSGDPASPGGGNAQGGELTKPWSLSPVLLLLLLGVALAESVVANRYLRPVGEFLEGAGKGAA